MITAGRATYATHATRSNGGTVRGGRGLAVK